MIAIKMATVNKCRCMAMLFFTIMVEKTTPSNPPALQSPWKEPTIFFTYFFWMVMDWVFIEIYIIRELKENKQSAPTKKSGVFAKPISVKAKVKNSIAIINGKRLSNFDTNQPEIGNPISELIGMANRTDPSSASLKLKKSLIVGIREAQVAKHKPDKKK